MESTTIIPNPTWGKTLQLFQESGHVFLLGSDSDQFKALLESVNLPYTVEDATKGELKLQKFVSPPQGA